MLTKLKNKKEGFTIIEVMIVLAIAGLIILIVLLAVPALQRNSRNTAIKNDAGATVGGVAEFASNNDGATPTAAASNKPAGSSDLTLNAASGTATIAKLQAGTGYNENQGPAAVTPAAGEIYVHYGAKCPTTVTGNAVTTVVNTRGVAVVYANETSGALQARCVDS